MNTYYSNKTKVVYENLMCFPVSTQTLEPLACSTYDPWAWSDPGPVPDETISYYEWVARRNKQWEATIKNTL